MKHDEDGDRDKLEVEERESEPDITFSSSGEMFRVLCGGWREGRGMSRGVEAREERE